MACAGCSQNHSADASRLCPAQPSSGQHPAPGGHELRSLALPQPHRRVAQGTQGSGRSSAPSTPSFPTWGPCRPQPLPSLAAGQRLPGLSSPYLGSVRTSMTHFLCGPTVVQFLARLTMAPASSSP